jgi:hypothetical protein
MRRFPRWRPRVEIDGQQARSDLRDGPDEAIKPLGAERWGCAEPVAHILAYVELALEHARGGGPEVKAL